MRCSRCKHAFFLPHPSSSQAEAVHSIAAEAASDPAPGAPTASADLDSSGSAFDATTAGFEPDSEEEDWQFNEEVRLEGDDDPEPETVDDFDAESDFGEGFDETVLSGLGDEQDLGTSGVAEGALDIEPEAADLGESGLELNSSESKGPEPDGSEGLRDESSFGSVDDFSSLMEDDDLETDLDADAATDSLGEADSKDASVGLYASGGSSDDLGDPESWDLIGSDGGAGPKPSLRGVVGSFGASGAKTGLGLSDEFLEGFGAAEFEEEAGEPSLLVRWGIRLGNSIGWSVTLVLIAAVLYASLEPEWARWSSISQIVSAGSFSAETVESGWIETSRAGRLLMVRGRVRNVGSETIWPRPVQVVLLDGSGGRLAAPPISGGTPLDSPILREAEPEVLEAARLAAVERYLRTPLSPGEVRPFEVLVESVPVEARRTLLEIGSPATAP